MKRENVFNQLENEILNSSLNEQSKNVMLRNIMQLKEGQLNVMITGATGSGKSSTINALFDMEVAEVGASVDPETMDIEKFTLDNMILWDTPGLGDGRDADLRHAKNIKDKLRETDEDGNSLIDLVLVVLDGSSRDLGTSYQLINNVIIPTIGPENSDRILIAINQADMAMKGRYWNRETHKPEEELVEFLEKKVVSIRNRIKESTGVTVDPIYYSAGFKEEGMPQEKPYNLSKLLYYIVQKTPSEKRAIYLNNLNTEPEVWEVDDEREEYIENTKSNIIESLMVNVTKRWAIGEMIGRNFGPVGAIVGKIIGGIVGGIFSVISGIFG